MLIGLCDRTERPFQNQDKGIFRTDEKAACLLYPGGAFRSAAFLFTCVQQSWTTLAGVSPVTVIAGEPCS